MSALPSSTGVSGGSATSTRRDGSDSDERRRSTESEGDTSTDSESSVLTYYRTNAGPWHALNESPVVQRTSGTAIAARATVITTPANFVSQRPAEDDARPTSPDVPSSAAGSDFTFSSASNQAQSLR
jgi:hypothetical protein